MACDVKDNNDNNNNNNNDNNNNIIIIIIIMTRSLTCDLRVLLRHIVNNAV